MKDIAVRPVIMLTGALITNYPYGRPCSGRKKIVKAHMRFYLTINQEFVQGENETLDRAMQKSINTNPNHVTVTSYKFDSSGKNRLQSDAFT